MAMLAKDLRTLPNYRKNWNYDLWCNCPLSAVSGGWKPTPPSALWYNAVARSPA